MDRVVELRIAHVRKRDKLEMLIEVGQTQYLHANISSALCSFSILNKGMVCFRSIYYNVEHSFYITPVFSRKEIPAEEL